MRTFQIITLFLTQLVAVSAFAPSSAHQSLTTTTSPSTTARPMAESEDDTFMKWARAARFATDEDEVIELPRPLGLILNQDPSGNVYVEKVAPRGNAARTGKINEGDIVTMCSATFGDEMWSCRGVGLTRVLAAIRVRSGPVRLVFESPSKYAKKKTLTAKQVQAKQEAAAAAQKKKDDLLAELEADEKVSLIDTAIDYVPIVSSWMLTTTNVYTSINHSDSTKSGLDSSKQEKH